MKTNKKTFDGFFQAMLVMAILLAISAVVFVILKQYAPAIVLGAFCIAQLVIFYVCRKNFLKNMRKNTLSCALAMEKEYKQIMDQWEQPMLLLAADASVCWENDAFLEMNGGRSMGGKFIDELGMGLENEAFRIDWQPVTQEIRYADGDYLVTMRKVRVDEPVRIRRGDHDFSRIYSITFKDITRIKALEQENDDLQPVVALIYVDNYEQVFESMDDSQKPLLQALLYRSLNNLADELGGVLYQLEKSRFYLSFHHSQLNKLKDSHFHILEEVKSIENGNRYPLTLSVGVGLAHNIADARTFAREAVDLSLGRGGDQAVLKDENGQVFYGGNSSAQETNSRVRPRLVAYALKEEIEQADRVIIMGHAHPDMDSIGSAMGLYRMVSLLNKPAHIVLDDDHPAIDAFCTRLFNQPEAEYAIIDAQKALGYFKNENVLLLITDCSRPTLVQAPELIEAAEHMAVIDHHRRNEDSLHPEICYIETYASSASELVSELLRYTAEKFTLSEIEADALFAGIILDTKYFTSKCGVRTFEAAAFLRRHGADPDRVRDFFKDDMENYQARGKIVSGAKLIAPGVLLSAWKGNIRNAEVIAAQAADEMLDISGIVISYVLTESEGTVKISARSLGNHNVQTVMEALSGGGHLNMAGATLPETTLEEAERKLMDAIAEVEAKRVK